MNTNTFEIITQVESRKRRTIQPASRRTAMQKPKSTLCAVLITALLVSIPGTASTQDSPPTTDPTTPAIILGQPFSATRYVRKVKILPDGKQRFLRNERYPFQIARDSEGRIRMESIEPQSECDRPELLVPPRCPVWEVHLFDLANQRLTNWPEGEIAGPIAVVFRLSAQQTEDAEKATSDLPVYSPISNWDGATYTTGNLGKKLIEGVRVSGIRITKEIPAGRIGNKSPIITIHETWTCTEMKLIIQTIDGDPHGEETVSGLEHVSLSPDPAIFQSPDGYEVQQQWNTDQTWKRVSRVVDNAIDDLSVWFPTQAFPPSQQ